ncbi:MAG: Rpn family recombination-promoting nuclease/putative transposase [Candidatus Electrothrix aestuarii]|uniref:Rpn family recombination-promoting nuclease/putative transposase n=1 Tax=Candidatus Electrothrix aestuarii TaxID=3062594 RepID=A0AAU8M2P8_9BACT|nr:Rpn family recombination-promoting nuclease/putative transposase [Candidatus Electrothrix aestuarii]
MLTKERYINLFTDYGFKKIFGEEPNKNLLLDFLNELLREEQGEIRDLTYLKTEQLGDTDINRKAIFDLYCENERGEKFIVELQKSKQNFFKDRALYYSTFPIREQAERGDWNFELKAVYTVAILDFVFNEDKGQPEKYRYDVKLSDIDTNKVFYDKLTFIYLEMPKFTKSLEELETRFDKWLYVIRNLNRLERLPDSLREKVFEQLFTTAEIARFTPDQVLSYEKSLKYYRDMKNSLDTAFDEGKQEKEREIVINGLQQGLEVSLLASLTGLSKETIEKIEEELHEDEA